MKRKFSFVLIFSSSIMLATLLISNNFIYGQTALIKNIYSISNDNLNFNSSQFSEIGKQIYKESISEMLPPNIELQYNGSNYFGELVSYKYREGYTFSALKEEQKTFDTGNRLISIDIPNIKNLTKYVSNNVITITNGSELKFRIIGYPDDRLEPSSLSINSYQVKENDNGKILQNPKILHIVDNRDNTTFNVNLSPGKYVFVATATTIPKTDEQVSGYVIYAYNIYIK
jgi:hypothetical protein